MAQDTVHLESLPSSPDMRQPADSQKPFPPMEEPAPGTEAYYHELDRKYRHRTYQAQELMIEKLMRGHLVQSDALEHRLNMFDLHFNGDRFVVVLVRPADHKKLFIDYADGLQDGGQLGLIVSSIFSELLGEHYSCFPTNLDDSYAFLLNFSADKADGNVETAIASICRDAIRFIHSNFSLELTVCVSGVCENLYGLHEVFRETDMVSADANTVFVNGVCARAEGQKLNAHRPEPSIEKQYLNALVIQDFQAALQLTLDRIQSIYEEEGNQDLERVKMFLNMRMHTTSSVLAVPLSDVEADGERLSEEYIRMDACSSMEEVRQSLTRIFNRLDEYFNTTPTQYTGTTGKVIALINKKYTEPDLSVEMICDCLGKSRSYLSRMFKENTGMNLLDYLHTTRLTHAKKLLNETDLGISEIAAEVGYYSGWTLARVFKRYEGITPTAYRKAFCGITEEN